MPTVPPHALATSSDSTGRNVRAEWAAELFFPSLKYYKQKQL